MNDGLELKMLGRGAKKRGETEKCEVCGSTSNLWVLAGYPGVGWRLLCPLWNEKKEFHNDISELQEERRMTHSPSLKKILQKDLEKASKKLGPKLTDVTL
jgi:hypothetical protein